MAAQTGKLILFRGGGSAVTLATIAAAVTCGGLDVRIEGDECVVRDLGKPATQPVRLRIGGGDGVRAIARKVADGVGRGRLDRALLADCDACVAIAWDFADTGDLVNTMMDVDERLEQRTGGVLYYTNSETLSPRTMRASPRDALRAEVRRVLAERRDVTAVDDVPNENALAVTIAGKRPTLFLDNLLRDLADLVGDAREAKLRSHVDAALATEESYATWAEAARHVVPAIRDAAYFTLAPDASRFCQRFFVPYVMSVIAVDYARWMSFATPDDLARWGVSEDVVYATALANLAPHAERGVVRQSDDTWRVESGDDYESSRLLLPGWLASFASRVAGRPVAAVPSRGRLYVTGEGSLGAVPTLAAFVARIYEADSRAISPALYTVDARGVVVPYRPASDPGDVVARGHRRLAERAR